MDGCKDSGATVKGDSLIQTSALLLSKNHLQKDRGMPATWHQTAMPESTGKHIVKKLKISEWVSNYFQKQLQ